VHFGRSENSKMPISCVNSEVDEYFSSSFAVDYEQLLKLTDGNAIVVIHSTVNGS